VLPDQLLAGEHPCGATPELTRERLAALTAAGISCFIDLTEPQELPAYADALPGAVQYHRLPIPDHGLPADPAVMRAILECILDALRQGQCVYLHCRAGIGRTGMTVGCLLAEGGVGGEVAIEELNRLWAASPRSRQWTSVPETDEQTAYVRAWSPRAAAAADPLLQPATLAAARGLRARFLGALLGLATGDAVGAATQYRRPGRFTPVGDLLGGGPFDLPRGAWSDDTAMALCLAESLLERQGFDARDQVERYRRWQQEGHLSSTGQCVGITAGTARALARAQWRRQAFSGSHDPAALDPGERPRGGHGPGGALRVGRHRLPHPQPTGRGGRGDRGRGAAPGAGLAQRAGQTPCGGLLIGGGLAGDAGPVAGVAGEVPGGSVACGAAGPALGLAGLGSPGRERRRHRPRPRCPACCARALPRSPGWNAP